MDEARASVAEEESRVSDEDASDDDARAHEDYSIRTPHERLTRDVEEALRRVLEGETERSAGARSAGSFALERHGLHWRREPYGCEVFFGGCDDATSARGGRATLGELLREARGRRAATVTFRASKRGVDAWDPVSFFDAPCVALVRPMSASGQFVDEDEALTVRAAFTLAMSALDVGDGMAVVTPRGYHEREFSGDVCDAVNGDAVVQTDVTRFTRFSGKDEAVARTFAGCVNMFLKQVRDCRLDTSTAAIEEETRELDKSVMSARMTFELRKSEDKGSCGATGDTSDDEEDEDDVRVPLVGSRRQNVHEDLENSDDFGLSIEEWDDDCPWARWVNAEDPWRSLELDALWVDEPFDGVYAFSELRVEDAPTWCLRGELTQAARDRGEDDDDFISDGTSSLSELIYALAQDADLVRATDATLDTASLASAEFWHQRGFDVPALPGDKTTRGVVQDIFASTSASASVSDAFREPLKTAPGNSLLTRFALHACLFRNARAVAHLWNVFVRELRQKYWERGLVAPGVEFDPALGVDHGACLLHQKLQLLNQCVLRRNKQSERDLERSKFFIQMREAEAETEWDLAAGGWDGADDNDVVAPPRTVTSPARDGFEAIVREGGRESKMSHPIDDELDLSAILSGEAKIPSPSLTRKTSNSSTRVSKSEDDAYASADDAFDDEVDGDAVAEGIAATLKIRLLRPPHAFMCAPLTQDAPLMTEDMLAEREDSLRALGDDERGRAARQRAQSDSLVSDMSAFKAANPRATFEDFVRWYSPKDWIDEDASSQTESVVTVAVAPRGHLSERMRQDGNAWAELWKDAPRRAAREQKSLFDPIVEGEKALHHLETIPAAMLLDFIARCACGGALGLLSATRAFDSNAVSVRETVRSAVDACSSVFARDGALTTEDYEFPVAFMQVAERTVYRAESLRVRAPNAPPALVRRLLEAASAWERARALDVVSASAVAVCTSCETVEERAYVASRLPKTPSSREHAIAAPTSSSALPGHRIRVVAYKNFTRVSRRIAVLPFT